MPSAINPLKRSEPGRMNTSFPDQPIQIGRQSLRWRLRSASLARLTATCPGNGFENIRMEGKTPLEVGVISTSNRGIHHDQQGQLAHFDQHIVGLSGLPGIDDLLGPAATSY